MNPRGTATERTQRADADRVPHTVRVLEVDRQRRRVRALHRRRAGYHTSAGTKRQTRRNVPGVRDAAVDVKRQLQWEPKTALDPSTHSLSTDATTCRTATPPATPATQRGTRPCGTLTTYPTELVMMGVTVTAVATSKLGTVNSAVTPQPEHACAPCRRQHNHPGTHSHAGRAHTNAAVRILTRRAGRRDGSHTGHLLTGERRLVTNTRPHVQAANAGTGHAASTRICGQGTLPTACSGLACTSHVHEV